jgi:hypothetical protein
MTVVKLDPDQQRATTEQQKFIEILAGDLKFDRAARNAHITLALGRKITFLDELTKSEASKVIFIFKEFKTFSDTE